MAEGAGALVLESYESAKARGAKILGVLEGCGEMADAFHRTRSSPDGKPIIGCIANAIKDAGLTPDDIDYVNAHGTSTPENDKMEYLGCSTVFGERMKSMPISSNKSMIGHTLSAAGAVEAVFTLLTLQHQRIPPTINYNMPDPAIPLDVVPNKARDARVTPRHFEFVRLRRAERLAGDGPASRPDGRPLNPPCAPYDLSPIASSNLPTCPPRRRPATARCKSASRRSRSTTSTCGAFAAWPSPSASCRWWSARKRPARSQRSGAGVTGFKPGDKVVMYGAMTCGHCAACREGRDNLCENVGGIMGFHIDGFARDLINLPARLVIPVPAGVSLRDAACAPIAFGTTEHMLFDNAKLKPGETILVHAGGSGIGSVAIKMAKAIGCTVITTVGDDAKAEKAKALGADHVINYKTERFEGVTRKLTAKKGVDVVFEHVGGEGFNASLFCLKRGGRLVTCGSTAGPTVTINLMQLFQQQYKIFGSFGASMRNIRDSLSKIAAGMAPIIDTEVALADFERGLARLESRQVFGKVIVNF